MLYFQINIEYSKQWLQRASSLPNRFSFVFFRRTFRYHTTNWMLKQILICIFCIPFALFHFKIFWLTSETPVIVFVYVKVDFSIYLCLVFWIRNDYGRIPLNQAN